MSQSIADLLGNRNFSEPPEIAIIRDFVQEKFSHLPSVSISQDIIAISVPSAALAGSLRPHLHTLRGLCRTEKRLIIRISS